MEYVNVDRWRAYNRMKELGMNHGQLASKVGVGMDYVTKLVRDGITTPALLPRFARALCMTEAELKRTGVLPRTDWTLKKVIEEYVKQNEGKHSASWKSQNLGFINWLSEFSQSDDPLAKLDSESFKDYIALLGKKYSVYTVYNFTRLVNKAVEFVCPEHMSKIPKSDWNGVREARIEKKTDAAAKAEEKEAKTEEKPEEKSEEKPIRVFTAPASDFGIHNAEPTCYKPTVSSNALHEDIRSLVSKLANVAGIAEKDLGRYVVAKMTEGWY